MQHKDYWTKRFDQLTDAQLNKGAEYYHNLEEQYRKAIQNVEKDLAKWYTRYATENGISLTEAKRLLSGRDLEEFRMDVKEYIKKGETLNYSSQWAKQLEAASVKVHVSRLEALKIQMQQQAEAMYATEADALDSLARNIYTDGYYQTAYEIQKGIGVGFDMMQLDTNKIDKLIAKPWAADGKNFSQRIWNNRAQLVSELENRLTQSIIRGQSPKKVIAEIAERFNVNKSKAGRLFMTESAFFASASQRDAFNDLGVERYEVLATLDSRTSPICRAMDGKVLPMSEYKPGVTAPPFHVYCRSTTVPYFDDEFTVMEQRAARDKDGKYYTVPANMKYEEWKATFVEDAGDKEWFEDIGFKPRKEGFKKQNGENTNIDTPVEVGGVNCDVRNEKFVFSDGSGNSKRPAQKAVIYKTPDGIEFVFPEVYDTKKQTMTPDMAISLYQKVPQKLRVLGQKTIQFVDYYNPQDAYWKRRYKNFTHSYATGGKDITFYRYDKAHNADYVVRTYCHEIGHKIDKDMGGGVNRYSDGKEWADAMAADKKHSRKKSPTTYGKNSPTEDFAESITEYIKNQNDFETNFPNRANIIKNILK